MAPTKEYLKDLLERVRENPLLVKTLDEDEETILALQKMMNPYTFIDENAGDAENQAGLAFSFTNLREDYLRRFTMTSMVGFLFRMAKEYEVPAEKRTWTDDSAVKKAREAETAPIDPAALHERAQAVADIAKLAAEAGAEAEAARSAANEAEAAVARAEADLARAQAVEEGVKGAKAAAKAAKAALLARLEAADAANTKARGLQYTATSEMARAGRLADAAIPRTAALAKRLKDAEVRAIVERDLAARPGAGEVEMPAEAARGVVRAFLREHFEYDPDAHVRKAYDELVVEEHLDRPPAGGVAGVPARLAAVDRADPPRVPLGVLQRAVAEADLSGLSAEERGALDYVRKREDRFNAALHLLRDPDLLDAVLAMAAGDGAEKFRRFLLPLGDPGHPAHAAAAVVPPQDTFHRWNYYSEVNMEALRAATAAIYSDQPDLDFAFLPYRALQGSEEQIDAEFETLRDEIQEDIVSDLKLALFGKWTLLADFAENRRRINFMNKHTDVLKRILDRHAEDKKLGEDLMKKRVYKAKAKNIEEAGPDAPGLAEYASTHGAKGMGAQKVISAEERLRLERARGNMKAARELAALDQYTDTIKTLTETAKVRELSSEEMRQLKEAQEDRVRAIEMLEVPEDAIQVDVITHDTRAGTLKKSAMYTKAEAPEHTRDRLEEEAAVREGRALPSAAGAQGNVGAAPPQPANIAPFAQAYYDQQAKELAAEGLVAGPVGEKAAPPPQ